ncbi:MAG: hypothetical protein ACK5XX_05175 [Holosporales bacterium]|nr:hypothetical protein [Thalassospira sp.]
MLFMLVPQNPSRSAVKPGYSKGMVAAAHVSDMLHHRAFWSDGLFA